MRGGCVGLFARGMRMRSSKEEKAKKIEICKIL